ncbi:hypothetical protein [Pluralibacter sp.]|uniref:hypothetical protein n=1 Tax=Pluralibacter sp. TaxID=1920032 RepID=UPI0025F736AB|nr:hypothetical protein [Pluralibacter sp.]MBV8042577.1 hypothetical protein [Pluralibacter sp.]
MKPVFPMRWGIRAALALSFLVMMSGTAEWLTWVNADRYPTWLAREFITDGNETSAGIIELMPAFQKLCGNPGGFAVDTKENGMFLRCDNSPSLAIWDARVYHIVLRQQPEGSIPGERL